MKKLLFLLTALPVLAIASEIVIDPGQSADVGEMDAAGRQVPSLDFKQDKTTVINIPLNDDQQNWEGKDTLDLELYNAKPGEEEFIVYVRDASDMGNPNNFPSVYFWKKISADWEGWQTFSIEFKSLIPSTVAQQNDAHLQQVSQVGFSNQIGPNDPENIWGVPVPREFQIGLGKITVTGR